MLLISLHLGSLIFKLINLRKYITSGQLHFPTQLCSQVIDRFQTSNRQRRESWTINCCSKRSRNTRLEKTINTIQTGSTGSGANWNIVWRPQGRVLAPQTQFSTREAGVINRKTSGFGHPSRLINTLFFLPTFIEQSLHPECGFLPTGFCSYVFRC